MGLLAAGLPALAADGATSVDTAVDTAALYRQHCAACHGEQRLGGMGPALLPESLARLRKPEALKVIRDGRAATRMLPFGATLAAAEIAALAEWIYTPVQPAPSWTDADIAKLTSGNILRVMRAVEAVAAAKKNEQPSLARLEPAA